MVGFSTAKAYKKEGNHTYYTPNIRTKPDIATINTTYRSMMKSAMVKIGFSESLKADRSKSPRTPTSNIEKREVPNVAKSSLF